MRLPSTVTILPGTPISPPKMLLLVSNRPSKTLLLVSIRPSRLVTFGPESLTRNGLCGSESVVGVLSAAITDSLVPLTFTPAF